MVGSASKLALHAHEAQLTLQVSTMLINKSSLWLTQPWFSCLFCLKDLDQIAGVKIPKR